MRKDIQIIDLPALHAPIQQDLNSAVAKVMNHQQFINGPEVALFENELGIYLEANVLGVGNGTDALEIALLTLGIGAGDEVLVPSFSYFASAEVIERVGAVPVFVDVDATFTIDLVDASSKISAKTKAIIAVHLFGFSANMEELLKLAVSNNLKLIEDVAQAIGGECKVNGAWRKVGSIGDMGCISFFPSKNLGAFGDGGAIISNNKAHLVKAKMLAQHGQSSKYEHDVVGMNSRLDTIQAAILSVKLPCLADWTKRRQELARIYKKAFNTIDAITLGYEPEYSKHVYHQFTMLVKGDRNKIKYELQKMGIPIRLYYPKAIHQQKAFSHLTPVGLNNTETFQSQMVSLPIHPTLTNEQAEYVVECVKSFLD
ncbi:MAG: UDP-2-acetamido-2-deoxy-ribo-hexuluronate aminotransferase [Salibacteraceae bacterium]|jgi:dTDP-4-amino-4,6-dideoxygalactose transaminase